MATSGDGVYGTLDPYEDPELGGTVVTHFWGRLRGDRIEGRYRTTTPGEREVATGEWSARRALVLQ